MCACKGMRFESSLFPRDTTIALGIHAKRNLPAREDIWFESITPHHLWGVCAWCAFVRNKTLQIPRAHSTRRVSEIWKKNRLGAGPALKAERTRMGVGFDTSFFPRMATSEQGIHANEQSSRKEGSRVQFPHSPPLMGSAMVGVLLPAQLTRRFRNLSLS